MLTVLECLSFQLKCYSLNNLCLASLIKSSHLYRLTFLWHFYHHVHIVLEDICTPKGPHFGGLEYEMNDLGGLKSEGLNGYSYNFKTKHAAGEYASLLNISANALAKIVKAHFNKTLTDLITERIIIEAKRQLYMTSKPVKEIAWLLGYSDEFYFSRVFKNYTDISPQQYRDTVGFAKAELN